MRNYLSIVTVAAVGAHAPSVSVKLWDLVGMNVTIKESQLSVLLILPRVFLNVNGVLNV